MEKDIVIAIHYSKNEPEVLDMLDALLTEIKNVNVSGVICSVMLIRSVGFALESFQKEGTSISAIRNQEVLDWVTGGRKDKTTDSFFGTIFNFIFYGPLHLKRLEGILEMLYSTILSINKSRGIGTRHLPAVVLVKGKQQICKLTTVGDHTYDLSTIVSNFRNKLKLPFSQAKIYLFTGLRDDNLNIFADGPQNVFVNDAKGLAHTMLNYVVPVVVPRQKKRSVPMPELQLPVLENAIYFNNR